MTLKILVAYHRECEIMQQYVEKNIYCKIFCGKDLNEVNENFIKKCDAVDNDGENLSYLNKNINEMTALYWAYKNYDKLGNPMIIGFNHYSRAFTDKDILNALNYDISIYENILPQIDSPSLIQQFIRCHTQLPLDILFKYLKDINDQDHIDEKFNSKYFYPKNMFIMRKELFLEYMKFIEKYIFICKKLFIDSKPILNMEQVYKDRIPGLILERISSIWFEEALKKYNGNTIQIPQRYI